MSDQASKPDGNLPDALRRKLVKSGLAAPVVLATLASKPVLGAAAHNCTISGQVSGNVSGHAQGDCRTLGTAPSGWTSPTASWHPCAYFFDTCPSTTGAGAKLFNATPAGGGLPLFVDAYAKNGTSIPTALELIRGEGRGVVFTPKLLASVELGREAVAALLSALHPVSGYPNYPVPPADVVAIFNSVANTGSYTTEFGQVWSHDQVLNYFKMLHY